MEKKGHLDVRDAKHTSTHSWYSKIVEILLNATFAVS
jgi:hypothetical protein